MSPDVPLSGEQPYPVGPCQMAMSSVDSSPISLHQHRGVPLGHSALDGSLLIGGHSAR
jgi:hypothetical protein